MTIIRLMEMVALQLVQLKQGILVQVFNILNALSYAPMVSLIQGRSVMMEIQQMEMGAQVHARLNLHGNALQDHLHLAI